MAQPYVGEIRIFAGNFAPVRWAFCDGQLLPISEYEVLFQLIGTTYGGDGQSTFALPDLRGRIPIHQGNGFILAETGGVEEVALTVHQIPAHHHVPMGRRGAGNQASPQGGVWAASNLAQFNRQEADTPMPPQVVGSVGGSQPHNNMMPYLGINFIISLYGIFPRST